MSLCVEFTFVCCGVLKHGRVGLDGYKGPKYVRPREREGKMGEGRGQWPMLKSALNDQ